MMHCFTLLIVLFSTVFPLDAERFHVDDLGYIYGVREYSLTLYDRDGKLRFVYSRMDLGSPSQLDVSDPLRPLLFYPETGTLVALDNTLSEQRVLRLWDGGWGMPQWVASGVNQEFWVYDALNKEVIRIDDRMIRRAGTGYLPAVTGHSPEIVGMAERHEQLIIADRTHGLWIFDRFGTFVRSIPIQGLRELRTHASGMSLATDHGLFWMRYGEMLPTLVTLPQPAEHADVDAKRMYLHIAGQLWIYDR